MLVHMDTALLQEALKQGSKLAADAIASRAKRYIEEIGAWLGKGKSQEIARLAVERLLAEAAAYPPTKALRVNLHSGPAEPDLDGVGINEDDRAAIVLRISNRADFKVQLAKFKGAVDVVDGETRVSYEIDSPSQLDLEAREELRLPCTAMLSRKHEVPRFSYGAVIGSGRLECLVVGPWKDEPHNVHAFQLGPVWLRVGPELLATTDGEYDEGDARNLLDDWVCDQMISAQDAFAGHCALYSPVKFRDLDETLGLRDGTSARLLPNMLVDAGWVIKRQGAQTIQVEPGDQLRLDIEVARATGVPRR